MGINPQFPADLFTFTKETLNGKLHFLCSVGKFSRETFTVFTPSKAGILVYSDFASAITKYELEEVVSMASIFL